MSECGPERIVLDATDEGRAGTEARHPHDGIGRGASGDLHRRPHGVVDAPSPRLVNQLHGALVHLLLAEEIIVGVRDHVDDGIADAEDIKTSCGH